MLRRDFTVNALMYDPFSQLLFDYTGGLADCAKQRLQCCGDPLKSFKEDPARMLRAVRLCSRTGNTQNHCSFVFTPKHEFGQLTPGKSGLTFWRHCKNKLDPVLKCADADTGLLCLDTTAALAVLCNIATSSAVSTSSITIKGSHRQQSRLPGNSYLCKTQHSTRDVLQSVHRQNKLLGTLLAFSMRPLCVLRSYPYYPHSHPLHRLCLFPVVPEIKIQMVRVDVMPWLQISYAISSSAFVMYHIGLLHADLIMSRETQAAVKKLAPSIATLNGVCLYSTPACSFDLCQQLLGCFACTLCNTAYTMQTAGCIATACKCCQADNFCLADCMLTAC